MARKTISVVIGDLFAIPRTDGRFVLGQVLEEWMPGIISVAVFDFVLDTLSSPLPSGQNPPCAIAIQSVGKAEVSKGYWRMLGHSHLLADPKQSPHRTYAPSFIGAGWHSGKILENLVDAYYSLGTWEPYPGRPGFLKRLLLSENSKKLCGPGLH